LYFIILLVLSILPVGIATLKQNLISYDNQKAIKELFANEDIPFIVMNGVLIEKNNDNTFVYQKQIQSGLLLVVSTAEDLQLDSTVSSVSVVLKTDGVYIYQTFIEMQMFKYDEYPDFVNLNLSDASQVNNTQFWNIIFRVAELELENYQPYIRFFSVMAIALESLLNILFVSLMLSLFQSFTLSGAIRFTELWKICIYLLAPYIMGSTLSIMFGNILLYYAGFLLTAIYVFMASRTILKDAMRRDKHEL
ncbi:MAG: hypothetical protein WCQ80_02750, partial [Bacilli bacterium]